MSQSTEERKLLGLAASRRCWLKLLEPIDALGASSSAAGEASTYLRFDNRPGDVRVGHLVFCVDPQRAVIFAVAEVLEDGDTALHDFEASATRWLFKVRVCMLAVLEDRAIAPSVTVAGGPTTRFSYRPLTRGQAERVASAVVARLQ